MITHSSILAWRIPWTEELGRPVHRVAQCWTQMKQLSMHAMCLKSAHFLQPVGLYLSLNLSCFQPLFLQIFFSPEFFSVVFWISNDMKAIYFITVTQNFKALFILSSIHILLSG